MDWAWIKEWWPTVAGIMTVLAFVVVPLMQWVLHKARGGLVGREDLTTVVSGLEGRVASLEKALHQHEADERLVLQRMEHQLAMIPSAAAITRLEVQITGIVGDIATIRTQIGGLEKVEARLQFQVDRLDEFLRKLP